MKITWFLDKHPIEEKGHFSIKNETWANGMMSTLLISSAKRRDSALFTCLVNNLYGKDETNIRLIVQEPPEPPKEMSLVDRRSREVRLSWTQLFNGTY